MKIFHQILAWSEVWALVIPLIFMIVYKGGLEYMKPIRWYVWITLLINFAIVMIYHYKVPWHFPDFLQSNNFLYNVHSIVRFFSFGWFFLLLKQPFLVTFKKLIMVGFAIYVPVNFIFFQDFFAYQSFSG